MIDEPECENKTEMQEREETLKRQGFRLLILKMLCRELNFDITRILAPDTKLLELFPSENDQNIIKETAYLKEKGYLSFHSDRHLGHVFPRMIKLGHKAIDLIEKIQTKTPTVMYEQDFSKEALMSFSNIYNSQVIINSPQSQIINVIDNEGCELLKYFEDLANRNKNNSTVQGIISNAADKIKNNKASKDYLRCTVDILTNFGISLTTNLLTPGVQSMLGLN